MANRRITFTDEQVLEIQEALKKNKNKNIDRRLTVLSMKAQGKTIDEIVARTGFNPTYARSLVTKYFAEGLESFVASKYAGNRRNLSFEEEKAFVEGFIEKAKQGVLTTVDKIKAAYEAKIGRKIKSKGHIYKILKRHGWRKIKPRLKHPKKASPEAIEASKKLTKGSLI